MSPCSENILQIQLMGWIGDRLRLTQMGPSRRDQCATSTLRVRGWGSRLLEGDA